MKKWEYTQSFGMILQEVSKTLNKFGAEGWEVVTVCYEGRSGHGNEEYWRAFFKRPIKEKPDP